MVRLDGIVANPTAGAGHLAGYDVLEVKRTLNEPES